MSKEDSLFLKKCARIGWDPDNIISKECLKPEVNIRAESIRKSKTKILKRNYKKGAE